MRWQHADNELEFGTRTVRTPYSVRTAIEFGDIAVVFTNGPRGTPKDDRDFDLRPDDGNVLGFDTGGTLQWILPFDPEHTDNVDDYSYEKLYSINEKPYVKHYNGRLYVIEVTDGTLSRSWPWNHLPLEGTVIELAGEIQEVVDTRDRVFVVYSRSEAGIGLYAFENDGTEVWHSEGRRGMIFLRNGELYEQEKHGPRSQDWYRLDQDTGERLENIEYPL